MTAFFVIYLSVTKNVKKLIHDIFCTLFIGKKEAPYGVVLSQKRANNMYGAILYDVRNITPCYKVYMADVSL